MIITTTKNIIRGITIMPSFPPMPPPPATPVVPNLLRGVLADLNGNDITMGIGVIAVNEIHAGNRRVLVRTGGEILINVANLSAGAVGDIIRLQCIDLKGNGEVWHVLVGSGATDMSKTVRAVNPIVDKRIDRFLIRNGIR